MNKEAQRIAIAEACGWNKDGWSEWHYITSSGTHVFQVDYLDDLNAMHEAEKTLSNTELWIMTSELANIVHEDTPFAHATASQRAEAFLRTLNLWTDS